MAKFTLTINCDNDAFEGDLNGEVARILRDAADRYEWTGGDGILLDCNGNTVGEFKTQE